MANKAGRKPGPRYWKQRDLWHVVLDGKRHILAQGKDNREEAERAFHLLMAGVSPPEPHVAAQNPVLTLGEIVVLYKASLRPTIRASTVNLYEGYLDAFVRHLGPSRSFHEVTVPTVTQWLDSRPDWARSTRSTAIGVIRTLVRWAVRSGLVATNPLDASGGLRRPGIQSRGRSCLITREEHEKIQAVVSLSLAEVMDALWDTGARPSEVIAVTAKDFHEDPGMWVLAEHKTSGEGGRERVILLTPGLIEKSKELIRKYPTGPLFRTTSGIPWTNTRSLSTRFLEARKALGIRKGVCLYSYRHTLATDALQKGVSDAAVAALLGHSSTTMVHRHYGHLTARVRALKEEIRKIR